MARLSQKEDAKRGETNDCALGRGSALKVAWWSPSPDDLGVSGLEVRNQSIRAVVGRFRQTRILPRPGTLARWDLRASCRSVSAPPTYPAAPATGFKSKNSEAPAVKREAEEDWEGLTARAFFLLEGAVRSGRTAPLGARLPRPPSPPPVQESEGSG